MENKPEMTLIIEAALLQGATRTVIEAEMNRRAAANGARPPEQAEIDAAYATILNQWIEDASQDEEKAYAYHVRMRKHLYQKSFSLNDFKTCLAIASDLAKLEADHRDRMSRIADKKRLDALMRC